MRMGNPHQNNTVNVSTFHWPWRYARLEAELILNGGSRRPRMPFLVVSHAST